ncbi:Rv3235 family protein [Streptomyces sp. NPDC003374]
MNKVMTRTQRRPGSRPPGRGDTRRPGTAPPRTPGGPRPRPRGGDHRPGPSGGHRPAACASAPGGAGAAPSGPVVSRPATLPLTTDVFADRLLAVLSGQKPVHWMLRHTAGRAYDELARLAERGPLRARGTRPVVRDIGYYEPRPGALEAFARIGAGEQLRAMAFRLELGRDLRWRCTAVELGGPRPVRQRRDD